MIIYQKEIITVFQSALYQTTSTLIKLPNCLLLVDPNWLPSEIASIQQVIQQQFPTTPLYLYFTHSDFDHILAYNAFPGAQTIASHAFDVRTDKEKIVQQIIDFDEIFYIDRPYSISYPKIDFIIKEQKSILNLEGTELVFYQTPGHNSDGLFLWIPSLQIWIVGDYLSNLEFPFITFDSKAYLQTLALANQTLRHEAIQLMIPGHGKICFEREEIQSRIDRDIRYIETLTNAVANQQIFDLKSFLVHYPHPNGLLNEHEKNVQQIKKELQLL